MSRTPSLSDFRKQQSGYVAAMQRDRCGNCQHGVEDNKWWSCKKNGLLVTAYAVCNDWTRKVPHGFKVPPP
jgi:hypothetical protein